MDAFLLYADDHHSDNTLIGVFTSREMILTFCILAHPNGKNVGDEDEFRFNANDGTYTQYHAKRIRMNTNIRK